MFRFRLRTIFLATTVVAIIFYVIQYILHFDDPIATLTISNDSAIVFSQETVLELSEAALRQVGLEPIEAEPSYGNESDSERFMGRNAYRPDDDLTVNWRVRGGSYPSYGVDLSREKSGIKAAIYENWLD